MPLLRSPSAPIRPSARRYFDDVQRLVTPLDFVTSTDLATWLVPGTAHSDASRFVWPGRDLKSTHRNNFVGARDAPTITEDWLDGNPGVTFDGTLKQVMRCGAFTGIGKGDKPCALIVASINADHPTGTPTLFYLAGKNSLLQASYQVLTVSVGAVSGLVVKSVLGSGGTASTASASAAGNYANGTPRLFMAVASNASDRAEAWSGNVLKATAAAGASGGLYVTPTHAVIGSGDEGGGATRWMDGTIGDVIVFRNKPSASELSSLLDGYYASWWPTIHAGLA